jgi:hypothetical protein
MRPLLILSLLTLTLAAAPIRWYDSYKEAAAQAREAHKPLMLFLSRPDCKSCAYMHEKVFTDKKVQAYVRKHFIAAELPIRDPGLPAKYRMKVSPVFTFLDATQDEIVEQIVGGKKAAYFLETLRQVVEDNPQWR